MKPDFKIVVRAPYRLSKRHIEDFVNQHIDWINDRIERINTRTVNPYSFSKSEIDALKIGEAAMMLGAGRATKEDVIDHAVGIKVHKKIGDKISHGDVIATIYTNGKNTQDAIMMIFDAVVLDTEIVKPRDIILKVVRG